MCRHQDLKIYLQKQFEYGKLEGDSMGSRPPVALHTYLRNIPTFSIFTRKPESKGRMYYCCQLTTAVEKEKRWGVKEKQTGLNKNNSGESTIKHILKGCTLNMHSLKATTPFVKEGGGMPHFVVTEWINPCSFCAGFSEMACLCLLSSATRHSKSL